MKAVVFLGPTLPVEQAREVLNAIYLPPAAQGDLLTATVEHRPDAIGLIDGVFLQTLSVWHKEILFALDSGVRVYGASSMGALRAAETAAFGMKGVGDIYRMYANEEIEDDDEVALAHTVAAEGYRKLSEPMVNIRATLDAARREGIIDSALHDQLTTISKNIYFADRTFSRILQLAKAAGVPATVRDVLYRFIATGYVDQKRTDALELLAVIKSDDMPTPAAATSTRSRFEFVRSPAFDALYNRGRRVHCNGVHLPLEDIANHMAVHEDDFDDLNFHALNRELVAMFAEYLGIDVGEAEIAAETKRFQRRRNLDHVETPQNWLDANNLESDEFHDLMRGLAVCRRMHQWFMITKWMSRTTRSLLDELRLTGRYEQWAHRAAAQEHQLQSRPDSDLRTEWTLSLEELVTEHCAWTGRTLPIEIREWAEEAGFHSTDNLRAELKRARAARRALLDLIASSPADTDKPIRE